MNPMVGDDVRSLHSAGEMFNLISKIGHEADVAQVSKPAVSPVSKPAGHCHYSMLGIVHTSQVWKPGDTADWDVCATPLQHRMPAALELRFEAPHVISYH